MLLTAVTLLFNVIWGRFSQMRRYLGYRPGEVHRVYRLLGLAASGRPGHGPVHLLLESAGELGFAWDSAEEGWLRPCLPPPSGCCRVLISTSKSLTLGEIRLPPSSWASFGLREVLGSFFSLPT